MRVPRDFDWTVLLTAMVLCGVGLALIYSVLHPIVGPYGDSVNYDYLTRQLVWVGLGMLSMLIGFAVPFRWYESLALVIFALCLVLLLSLIHI